VLVLVLLVLTAMEVYILNVSHILSLCIIASVGNVRATLMRGSNEKSVVYQCYQVLFIFIVIVYVNSS